MVEFAAGRLLRCFLSLIIFMSLLVITHRFIGTKTTSVYLDEKLLNPQVEHSSSENEFMKNYLKNYSDELEHRITEFVNNQNSRCRPNCTNRENQIIIKNQGTAGLGDRLTILHHTANLASYFCATVLVDKPCELIDYEKHGKGNGLSCDLAWSDFKSIDRYNGSVIGDEYDKSIIRSIQSNNINNQVELKGATVENFDKATNYFNEYTSFSWIIDHLYYSWRADLQNHFDTISKDNQTPFPVVNSYGLDRVYNRWDFDQVQNELECMTPLRYTPTVVYTAEKVLLQTKINSDFGSLHIRRGDAASVCNTDLKNIKNYLECSLKSCKENSFSIILFTDETSETYINGISEILSSLNHTMLNGENLIKKMLKGSMKNGDLTRKHDNNFFVFEVSNYIKQAARYHLVQRRRLQCNDCDEVCSD